MMESATHSGSRALRLIPITQKLLDLRIANIVDGRDRVKEKAYRPRSRAASVGRMLAESRWSIKMSDPRNRALVGASIII